MGSLDLEQKSSADEREAYKGTTSEETAIEKEQKKKKFGEFQHYKPKDIKIRAKMSVFLTPSLFFGYA